MKKLIIAGTKGKYILKFKGGTMYHRVHAKSLLEAKAKMLKGTRYTFQDVLELKRKKKSIKKFIKPANWYPRLRGEELTKGFDYP
jgi:hypothetical protein